MRLLLPPGLGDLHWCMLKMRPFIQTHCPDETPIVHIASNDPDKNRAGGYVDSLPFVEFGGYVDIRKDRGTFQSVFTGGRVISNHKWLGQTFDLYIGCNAQVQSGAHPESWWPHVLGRGVDWHYPITLSPSAADKVPGNPYVLVSFYRHGWYQDWTKALPPFKVIEQIRRRLPDHEIIITGAKWDVPLCEAIAKRNNLRSLAGQTTMKELLALIDQADLYVGHAAGNAMLASHMGVPTVMLWGTPPFRREMWRCWIAPVRPTDVIDVFDVKAGDYVYHAIDDMLEMRALQKAAEHAKSLQGAELDGLSPSEEDPRDGDDGDTIRVW